MKKFDVDKAMRRTYRNEVIGWWIGVALFALLSLYVWVIL